MAKTNYDPGHFLYFWNYAPITSIVPGEPQLAFNYYWGVFSKGFRNFGSYEGLGDTYESEFADTCAEKFPLVLMGG